MAEMRLDGGEVKQRGMLIPVLIALVLLAAGGAWFAKVYLHKEVTGKVDRIGVFPVHTVFTRGTGILVGENQTEDVTYVIPNIALTDHTEVPLFVKSISGSFTMEDGSVMQAQAIEQSDLPRLAAMFPKMKPAVDTAGTTPLQALPSIAPGATAGGYVVFAYNVPQAIWDKRKSSDVSIDFYHQDRVTLPLPK
ncbi:hypothetical protein Terro_3549 [Terriglobus roseus DSM 18391]|uniref:Uncharacterized protein n=1 Tax=Terriglobus roseus (strain DSM 18391 / NRRL B-41598 / KBS 63) TaxID=926566 RepID=I3ZKJ5_TERRK|nr:hypothetical protein [Terriglobus roseus]AFL89763.1 hypothetical protein Terro_3549 [Terriglobus roseus DSM 18391]